MMMFETSKHVPKTEKHCCVFKKMENYVYLQTTTYNMSSLWFLSICIYAKCKDIPVIDISDCESRNCTDYHIRYR